MLSSWMGATAFGLDIPLLVFVSIPGAMGFCLNLIFQRTSMHFLPHRAYYYLRFDCLSRTTDDVEGKRPGQSSH